MRLDHLLSKEHLQRSVPRVCGCSGVVRSTPVAQTIVLRRVLTGGISANRCLAAQAGSKYGSGSLRGPGPGTLAGMIRRVVFGTLLGPETTGPWPAGRVVVPSGRVRGLGGVGLVCFWFPGCTDHTVGPFCGGLCGVCGTGLLFENYIVDASIFYKKQFPRI